jgi:hypothetical protein
LFEVVEVYSTSGEATVGRKSGQWKIDPLQVYRLLSAGQQHREREERK